MKELKSKRLVSFGGICSSWAEADEHRRNVKIAKELEATQFRGTVLASELPPLSKESTDDRVRYTECIYYKTDAPVLVDEDEYLLLKRIGVKDLKVLGIYAENMTQYSQIVFYALIGTFITWNLLAAAKFIGLI